MSVFRDLRQSARSFTRTPGVTLILLLTIALGVGSNASVIGFARGSITRDLPLPHVRSMVSLFARDGDRFSPMSYDTYVSLKAQDQVFESVGAAREARSLVVVNERSSLASIASVTPELADLFQLPLGRGVVISHRWWQRELDGKPIDPVLLLRIDGSDTHVATVAPEWLEGLYAGSAIDIWVQLQEESLDATDRRSRTFWAFGRLAPRVSPDRAEALVNATRSGADLLAALPYTGMTPDVARGLLRIRTLLSAAAAAVFFIACVNVATFLLSRASARSHETSVRVALGATRRRLLGQLAADSLFLSVGGAALGTLAAWWTTHLVAASLFDADAGQLVFAPDRTGILLVSVGCAAIVTGCGLLPILQIRDDQPAAVLRRESAGPSRMLRRLRSALVIAQMTCCCVLVIFTALLFASFRAALQTRAGHHLDNGILATVQASGNFDRPDAGVAYFQAVEATARSLPDSSGFAWTGMPPGSRPGWQLVRLELPQAPLRDALMDAVALTPRSLDDIELPPVAGRLFGAEDRPDSCKVVVVDNEAARLFDGDAVGQAIDDPDGRRVEVIGIVANRETRTKTGPHGPTVFYYPQQLDLPAAQSGRFRIPARGPVARGALEANIVSAGYFETMGLSRSAGRLFDDPARGCREAVVNQEAAELYFRGDALGGAVIDSAGRRTTIVGIVRSSRLRASQRRPEAAIYFPMAQNFLPRMTLMFNAREADEDTLRLLRRRIDAVAGGLPGKTVITTLEAHLTKTALAPERIAVVLVGGSAATALALGVLGLYGAMLETTRQRRREFAVRAALGAPAWRVIRHVLAEGVQLAAAGTVAGTVASLVLARWMSRITPDAGPLTGWIWLTAAPVLLGAVALAGALPARQAAGVNLLTIMRQE